MQCSRKYQIARSHKLYDLINLDLDDNQQQPNTTIKLWLQLAKFQMNNPHEIPTF